MMSLGVPRIARSGSALGLHDHPSTRYGQTDCHVQRLTYLSTARDPDAWTPKFLDELEEKLRTRNQNIGVGGFMLFTAPFFFEVLEGYPEVVGPLFELIQRDPHHDRCIVLLDVRCSERLYASWQLRRVNVGAAQLPPMVSTLLRQLAAASLSMWRFLPRSAGDLLLQGKDPRSHPPQFERVVVAFVRIAEFDALLAQPPLLQHLADLLEVFVDVCAHHVDRTGGQFAKFVNGASMLFWPASCALAAFEAVCRIISTLKEISHHQPPNSALSLLNARAGIHTGRAILCNAGVQKADFTLLGDCVNVASRLTSMARELKYTIIVSAQLRALVGEAGPTLPHVGSLQVKGRNEPVECYRAPGPPLDGICVRHCIEDFTAANSAANPPRRPVREFYDVPYAERPLIFENLLHPCAPTAAPPARPTPAAAEHTTCWPWRCWHRPRAAAAQRQSRAKVALRRFAPEGPGLINLLYIARIVSVGSPDDQPHYEKKAIQRMKESGITSELVHFDGLYMHHMEGTPEAVAQQLDYARQSSRLQEVAVIHVAPIKERTCSSPLAMHRMTVAALEALPLLPELLVLLTRAIQCLETYVPCAMVHHILAGREPRSLKPTRVSVVMMASDIVGFTLLTEGCPLTEVWHLCTTFIEICTEEIHRHGGHIIKLIGDCVTAYFRPDAAEAALEAAQGIIRACRARRQRVHPLDCRSVMACGVGLDYGPVVMAQCGSRDVAKFLVTGEVSARVMEVEALTRSAGRKIVVSQSFADQLPPNCPLEPLSSTVRHGIACFAYSGAEWSFELAAIQEAIGVYHQDCRAARSTPLSVQLAEVEEKAPANTSFVALHNRLNLPCPSDPPPR